MTDKAGMVDEWEWRSYLRNTKQEYRLAAFFIKVGLETVHGPQMYCRLETNSTYLRWFGRDGTRHTYTFDRYEDIDDDELNIIRVRVKLTTC